MDIRNQFLYLRLGAIRREIRDLRLEGACIGGGCIDNGAAKFKNGIGAARERRRKTRRFRIKTDAEHGVGSPPCCIKHLNKVHEKSFHKWLLFPCSEHFFRMLASRLSDLDAAEHPGDFLNPSALV